MEIFISYETTTGLQIAKHLKKSLKKLGLNAFVANEDIKIGNDWKNSIECAIKDCKYFILILTNLALGAEQVHVEVNLAIEFKKQIILCRKSNVYEKGIDMAFPFLSSLQRIDFKDEYELADYVISTILEREIDLRYSFGLGPYYYEIEKIGEGSFSMVYKAKRKTDNEVVALNIIHRLDKTIREWLIKSISFWMDLKHRNILRLYKVGLSPFFYLELEFCEKSLSKYNFPLPINNAVKYIMDICDGLDYAHKKGVIHGDLKPDNILFRNNIPKISDWGLSKILKDTNASITTIAFTPMYAAPEQLSLSKIDARTDLYQLGAIFYEMVTGQYYLSKLFLTDETVMFSPSIRSLIESKDYKIVPPSTINPLARSVEPIIMKLLAYNKEDRYQSAAELKKDLKRIIGKKRSETI